MTVTRGAGRAAAAVAAGAVLAVSAGCAGDDPAIDAATDPTPAIGATSTSSAPAPQSDGLGVVSTTVTGTGDDPATDRVVLDGFSGELILTRQRDLLDRGLINVQVVNDSGSELTITDRRLVPEHFDTEPAAARTSRIPVGRPVHLQVPYGSANDCTADGPVTAVLQYTYSIDGSTETDAVVELGGTELLDRIRAEQCAQGTFEAAFDAAFEAPAVDDEALDVELVLTPATSSSSSFRIVGSDGTILVEAAVGATRDTPVELTTGRDVRLPVRFSVIRCDPHAMAEVTKRYGLSLRVEIDGEPEPYDVDVDVSPLLDPLAEIVENCRRKGNDDP